MKTMVLHTKARLVYDDAVQRLRVEARSGAPREIALADPLVVVAGFTGRDAAAVERHIAELGAMGVPRPERVPALYPVPNWLLRPHGDTVQVAGRETSGEVEPVLIRTSDGDLYVTVGSDHTDRRIERESFQLAKQVCPKVIGDVAWPFVDVEEQWDELVLESRAGEEGRLYQRDVAGTLLSVADVLELTAGRVPQTNGRELVVFLGTVPMKGEVRADPRFAARLEDPVHGRSLTCGYEVEVIDVPTEVMAG